MGTHGNGNRGSLFEETPDWYPSRDVARLGSLTDTGRTQAC